ncbi:MAG: hypothetical protein IPK93_05155 [Solirubrobacterales bacterium]|nr:hypothetical protein [Solirubrobacterales bacterium]
MSQVKSDADALRLSKLMNVNQHEFLRLLLRARTAGVPDALLQFLSPEYAESRVTFVNVDETTLKFDRIEETQRQETYALGKASRLIRIAFDSLDEYSEKEVRNVQAVPQSLLEEANATVDAAIGRAKEETSSWREPLVSALDRTMRTNVRENQIQGLIAPMAYLPPNDFGYLRDAFTAYMDRIGEILAQRFHDDAAIKEWELNLGDEPALSDEA